MKANGWRDLEHGSTLTGQERMMTEERLRWYGDGMLTSSAGEPVQVGTNIHTDDEYAQAEGLPKAIADGMLSANWLADMLIDYFGEHYMVGSHFKVKFIKPVFVGSVLSPLGHVTATEKHEGGGITYQIDLSISDQDGVLRTVGEASVTVPASAM